MTSIRSLLGVLVLVLAFPLSAPAATQTILGKTSTGAPDPAVPPAAGPLSVFVGDTGSLQAKRGAQFETVAGMFFGSNSGPAANFWHLRVKGAPAAGVTFGPRDTQVATISNGPVTGDYTTASPARVDTVMRAGDNLFEIKQTTLYVAPELRYRVIYDIRNLSAQTVPFIFGTSADLFIESDAGEGLFIDGPTRFIGGRNKFSGTVGGVEQVTSSQLPGEAAATPVAPWASWEEGDPFPVTRRLSSADAFLNTINPVFMDNAGGVSFNDRATSGLAAGATARYEVVWHVSRTGATTPLEAPPAAPAAPTARESVPPPPEATSDAATPSAVADAAVAPGAPAVADTSPPVLSVLRLAPSVPASASSRGSSPPKIVFRLSEPAGVVLRVVRRTRGRRVTVQKLTRGRLAAGSHTVRLGARRLAPGSYVVTARAIDAAGNAGALRSAAFRIAARRR
jgi:hypothetical protein